MWSVHITNGYVTWFNVTPYPSLKVLKQNHRFIMKRKLDINARSGVGNLRLASHMRLFGCDAAALSFHTQILFILSKKNYKIILNRLTRIRHRFYLSAACTRFSPHPTPVVVSPSEALEWRRHRMFLCRFYSLSTQDNLASSPVLWPLRIVCCFK